MEFREAYLAMQRGYKVKLPSWTGYWKIEDGTIKMHCHDGKILDIRETDDVFYTFDNITSSEWLIVEEDPNTFKLPVREFKFGRALELVKSGIPMARKGWNGKGMFIVYQKGYPDGIPCNKQTAEAWGMKEGDLFVCNPYLQIKNVDGSHSMWVPSINDVLANDWIIVDTSLPE